MERVRWAFPCAAWRPGRQDWLLAARLVQPEERDRVRQLVFARDAKAALVPGAGGARLGRLHCGQRCGRPRPSQRGGMGSLLTALPQP